MQAVLVIEDLDEIEELRLRIRGAIELLTELDFERAVPALHGGVVETVAAPTHAAGDASLLEHLLIVLARVGASLIRVVKKPGTGASAAQCHVQGLEG